MVAKSVPCGARIDSQAVVKLNAAYLCNLAPIAHFGGKPRPVVELFGAQAL
jgi:hypothetical protein